MGSKRVSPTLWQRLHPNLRRRGQKHDLEGHDGPRCRFDWEIEQMDVVTAFLNGEADDEIYVELPPGFELPHDYRDAHDHDISLSTPKSSIRSQTVSPPLANQTSIRTDQIGFLP